MGKICGSRKNAFLKHTSRLVRGGPLDTVHNLKKGTRQYRLLGKNDNDLVKDILTICDKAALPTLVALLYKYQVRERIKVHNMDVCHILVPAQAYVCGVSAPTSSDVVEKRVSEMD